MTCALHCFHATEILPAERGQVARERQICCWCGAPRTADYRHPAPDHGPWIYRGRIPTTTGAA